MNFKKTATGRFFIAFLTLTNLHISNKVSVEPCFSKSDHRPDKFQAERKIMPSLYPPDFGLGAHGAAVASLQHFLKLEGLKEIVENGIFDENTEAILRQFQTMIGCKPTGRMDQGTREGMRLRVGFNPDGVFFPDSDPNAPRNSDPESPDITCYTLPGIPGELRWDFQMAMAF
jgi:hypothetical protein